MSNVPLENNAHPFWEGADASGTPQEDLERKRKWRLDADTLAKFRNATTMYLGSHNFHNFTVGREFADRSNHRFMKRIEVRN